MESEPKLNRLSRMQAILESSLHPESLQIWDVSLEHAGHPGNTASGESHYKLSIKSQALEPYSPVEKHRKIYSLLAQEFQQGLHALEILIQ